eukprot:Rhum_TRINITY_DN14441_c4_g1::Rhum_TRINITY_DN14441_c4_g1_i3::g.89275::m.89275
MWAEDDALGADGTPTVGSINLEAWLDRNPQQIISPPTACEVRDIRPLSGLDMLGAAAWSVDEAGGGGGAASVGRASREAVAQERSTLNRELNTLQAEIATLRGVDPAASPATRAGTGGRAAALRRALARRAAARSDGGGGGDGSEEKPAQVLTEVRTPPAHDGRLIRVGAENLTAVTVTGTIKVVAAVMVCNCPSLVGDGSASALLKLSKEGDAFVHSYPFHEQYGDANGLKDVTAAAREACDGKETCAYSLRSERPPVSSCQPKLALEYACATSEEAATSEAAYLLLRSNLRFSTKVLAPQMDSVGAALSCSAPALAAGLERFAAVVASPERARLRRAGEFAEADAVTVDVTRTAGPKYDQATTTKQIRGARPVTYEAEGHRFNSWPVQFSIPSVRFANTVAWKKEGMQFAPAIPGNKNTYQNLATKWNSEEVPPDDAFWSDYRHSYYCVTRKKKGWDCLRHYEILATGCVPYFVDIHRLPAATMPFFPRQLVMEAMALPGVTFHDTKEGSFLNRTAYTIDHNVFPKERYFKLAAQIQEHARRHLTSEAMAQYVLDALAAEGGPKRAKKVLYIHHCYPDFLGDSLWAGFKELEAQGKLELVADIVPPREHAIGGADSWHGKLYDMARCEHGRKLAATASERSLSKKTFYEGTKWAGWGNHRSHNAFPKETAVDPQTLPDRIAAREFDVVVYGT